MKLGGGEYKRINSKVFQLLLSVYNYLVSDACNKAALYRVWFLERRQWHPIGKILGLHPPNRRSVWLMWNSYNSCWNDTAEDCGCVAGEGAELSSIDIWFPLYNNWPLLPAPPPPHLSIAVAWDLLFQSSSHIPCMRRAPGNPTRGAASKAHWHSEASPPRWAEPNIPRAEEGPNESQTIGFHKLNGGFLPLQTKKE